MNSGEARFGVSRGTQGAGGRNRPKTNGSIWPGCTANFFTSSASAVIFVG